jgi:pimeloyl-ACP methyl ester carboxylesterase
VGRANGSPDRVVVVQPASDSTDHLAAREGLGVYCAGMVQHEQTSAPEGAERLVDMGGRHLAMVCAGSGRPAVVLESGLDIGVGLPSAGWAAVQDAVAGVTHVCRYDRAGLGRSDPIPPPRTGAQMVEDLRSLLQAAGEEPPYVLVGHSMGGMVVRLYAYLHPDEVRGVVLVDSSHQDQFERIGSLLPPALQGASAQYLAFRRVWAEGGWRDPTGNREGVDFPAMQQELNAVTTLGDLPVRLLVSGEMLRLVPDPAVSRRLHEQILEMQQELARLSTRSELSVLEDSGHFIHQDQPEAVIEAIRDMVALTR